MYKDQTFRPPPTLDHLHALCTGVSTPHAPRGGVVGSVWLNADHSPLVHGLRVDALHEFFGWSEAQADEKGKPATGSWVTPMTLAMRVGACLALQACTTSDRCIDRHRAGSALVIGRRVWPDGFRRLSTSTCGFADRRLILVDAETPAHRLWATDLALRSGAFGVVLADGSGFDLASTRRLQLACESGRTACVLARPPWEERVLSAAASRWRVRPAEVECRREGTRGITAARVVQRWSVDLLRCKGLRPTDLPAWSWRVEEDHAAGACRLVADVLDRRGDENARGVSVLGNAG